ncbi:SDR family oxidoreductase [Escherichia coli O13]|uniref:SDR family NAD(P)-dependent oxidoreductase n=2 Tax=Escherichia coli TaxID=562 RepID=UPI000BE487BB|nr:SDR family oxidoreductase [Escherichia coli]EFA4129661.1 SDR family oxidoreductase [Escherichia coli O13]EFI5570168.1 SDR family oxidoreductase [Escherichia coli]EFJ3039873.1 SDR family oxidoreductase [Escherichia coli]MBB7556846.1 SDR family oxidoreductase [Escherichia coli]HAW3343594.1 SDR family oxidoreductase [Escherichia coli]
MNVQEHNTSSTGWFLVTGATRGIGLGIARELASHAPVIVTSRSPVECELSENIRNIICDSSDVHDVENVSRSLVSTYGPPSGIVHNVSIAIDKLHIHYKNDDVMALLNTNIVSVFAWHRFLLPAMIQQQKGSIIFISSVSAIKGNTGQSAYAASKAALSGMMLSLVRETARFGIRVNTIAPGIIDTDMIKKIPCDKFSKLSNEIPARRIGTIEDVSRVVAFFMSDDSRYITGQFLAVDGGLTS